MEIYTKNINDCATEYEGSIEDLRSEYKKINTSLENLKKYWQGDRATKFFNATINTYLPELKTAIDSLEDYEKFISNVPKVYSTLDNSYASKKIDV